MFWEVFAPKHFIMCLYHFISAWKVEPDLKKLEWIFFIFIKKGEHFGMLHTLSCGHPLNITISKSPCRA